MKTLIYLAAMAALALTTSFLRAGEENSAPASVVHSIRVKTVSGSAEYAYDSSGWRTLKPGIFLHAGASVRTGAASTVVFAMEESGSLVRVGPHRRLDFAKAAPTEGTSVTIVPMKARLEKGELNGTEVAAR